MSRNALDYLQAEFVRAIDYATEEFKITTAEVIGCLEVVKLNHMAETQGLLSDDGEQEVA